MSDLDKYQVRQDTRYSEAVNRYLGAAGYRESLGPAPAPLRPAGLDVPVGGVVLVGVDETPTSYNAVDHAAIEAELRGWDLRLVHVQHEGGLRPPSRGAGERLLEHLTERVHAYSPTVAVTSRLAVGPASPLLLSDAHNANLVVVGHRYSAAGTAFGLSASDRVAARHGGPVLVVRVPGWPLGPEFGKRPIVVGVGATTATTPAVDFGIEEARVRGCELVVIHAGKEVTPSERTETVGAVRVHRREVADDAVAALIDASNKAAAVVVGRRAPDALPTGLLGSVSRGLVQRAYCPVFLVG